MKTLTHLLPYVPLLLFAAAALAIILHAFIKMLAGKQ